MIRVDETDPVGEIEPSFPYRDVTVRRGIEFKDHYDIQSEIGRGKFGTVYRCKEKLCGLSLAAKVVNTARKEDRRAVEREVEIMRRLQHPRLIQLYDAIDTGKHIYVILELIEGGELFERVIDDDFVLTERSCAVFMRQICEGMEFVHAQNILHLDMKPENILCLTKEGNRIKIIDFGLARQYDPDKKLQVLFGTPEFVAPEVVNFDQIGFGTDMWSIGVICYVLLSGLSPFMGDTDVETMANVTIAKYDFDDEAFADISEDAKDFIKNLLVKDKEGRATAYQCRKHAWLARKDLPPPAVPSKPQVEKTRLEVGVGVDVDVDVVEIEKREELLDVTKDNLRLFVERWRDHPNSPYSIESVGTHRWDSPSDCGKSIGLDESNIELISLCGQSPSPCESLCSSTSEPASSPRENGNFLLSVPCSLVFPFDRRASEGTGTGHDKQRDPVAQIVLAEEIIKLSEHLRSISTGPSVARADDRNESVPTRTPSRTGASAALTRTRIDRDVTNPTFVGVNPDGAEQRDGEKVQVNACRSYARHYGRPTVSANCTERNEISEKLSSIAKQRKLNGTIFNGVRSFERNSETTGSPSFTLKRSLSRTSDDLQNDRVPSTPSVSTSKPSVFLQKQDTGRCKINSSLKMPEIDVRLSSSDVRVEREMDLTPPWRRARAKHRFGETCRDVPRISNLRDLHRNLNLNEPTSTKDLLLQLLEEWDDVTRPTGVGRKSVSVDWCGEESIARRSMNSLAEYFQSEQQKPAAPRISPARGHAPSNFWSTDGSRLRWTTRFRRSG